MWMLTVSTLAVMQGCVVRNSQPQNTARAATIRTNTGASPWDDCESPMAKGLYRISSSLAGARPGGRFSLCAPLEQAVPRRLTQTSSETDRVAAVAQLKIDLATAAPGFTFVRDSAVLEQSRSAFDQGSKPAQDVLINLVVSDVSPDRAQLDVWSGHETLLAALAAGKRTMGDLQAVANVEVLVNGWRAGATERWKHMIAAAGFDFDAGISYIRIPEGPRVADGTILVDSGLGNFALGSRTTVGDLERIMGQTEHPRIGMACGTFDPPHEGHFALCLAGLSELQFNECLLLPNYNASHKPHATEVRHRVRMTELRLEGKAKGSPEERLNVYSGDSSRIMNEFGIGVFFERIQDLYGTDQVWSLVGDDAYEGGILRQGLLQPNMTMKYYINPRNGSTGEGIHIPPYVQDKVKIWNRQTQDTGLSSTKVREALLRGDAVPTTWMDPDVLAYICAQQPPLYGAECAK